MSRTAVDWSSASRANYINFCRTNSSVKISYLQWKSIIYGYNESFRDHILETGEKIKMPFGFGEFSINKKIRKKVIKDPKGVEHINLPIDWVKTKQKHKIIYNFNFHTEGYFFGWIWFRETAQFKHADLWYFKPSRTTKRLLAHYLKTNDEYKTLYNQWTTTQKTH